MLGALVVAWLLGEGDIARFALITLAGIIAACIVVFIWNLVATPARLHEEIRKREEHVTSEDAWIGLFREREKLEQDVLELKASRPGITIKPALKIGMDKDDVREAQIKRKELRITELTEMMAATRSSRQIQINWTELFQERAKLLDEIHRLEAMMGHKNVMADLSVAFTGLDAEEERKAEIIRKKERIKELENLLALSVVLPGEAEEEVAEP